MACCKNPRYAVSPHDRLRYGHCENCKQTVNICEIFSFILDYIYKDEKQEG